jgi:hypothetical protein
VFHFREKAPATVDVRGGGAGTPVVDPTPDLLIDVRQGGRPSTSGRPTYREKTPGPSSPRDPSPGATDPQSAGWPSCIASSLARRLA